MTPDHEPDLDLDGAFRRRSERGTPRGADAVLAGARADDGFATLAADAPGPSGRRWLVAAAAVLVLGGVAGALALTGSSDPEPTPPASTTPRCTDLLVYLDPAGTAAERDAIEAELVAAPNVEEVRYADHERTYREFQRLFEGQEAMLENVKPNDLPTSFRVVAIDPTGPAPLADLVEQMRRREGVFEVRALPADVRCDPAAAANAVESADDPDLGVATTAPQAAPSTTATTLTSTSSMATTSAPPAPSTTSTTSTSGPVGTTAPPATASGT